MTVIDYKEFVPKLKSALEKEGYSIAVGTIRKYVHQGLTKAPNTFSLGQGKGKRSEYEEEALGEIYAAWKLLNGPIQTSLERLKEVSKIARELYSNRSVEIEDSVASMIEVDSSIDAKLKMTWRDLVYLIELWINYCEDMSTNNFYRVRRGLFYGIAEDEKMKIYLDRPNKITKKQTHIKG